MTSNSLALMVLITGMDDGRISGMLPTLEIFSILFFTYKSSKGIISERQVKVSSSDGSEYIYAQCFLRNEARTFRIDRIQNCTNLDTDEVVDNIPLFFREKYDHA